MEWPKLKNIIILMLAAVNVMLLVLVLSRQMESRRYSENARDDAVAILWETGRIQVARELLPDEMDLPVLTVARDTALEERQAQGLLGQLEEDTRQPSHYEGERGSAQFYANGGFAASFHAGALPLEGREPEEFAVDFLRDAGIEAQVVLSWRQGDETCVQLRQLWEGVPVFDCGMTLIFRGGELRAVQEDTSRRLVGEPRAGAEQRTYTVATMLMRFMEYIMSNHRVCGEIYAFTPGYVLEGQTEPMRMLPAWYVETDQGGYYWNAVTGEIRPAASVT